MPTMKERHTVAKLILYIANATDEHRKEIDYDKTKPHPEFTLEELKPLADEAVKEAQEMLASWGGR
jgi:hypothetical protein